MIPPHEYMPPGGPRRNTIVNKQENSDLADGRGVVELAGLPCQFPSKSGVLFALSILILILILILI
jgi:hypothetical protein